MKRLRGRSPHRLQTASPSRRLVPPLWRNRDFILLWSGQVVSTIGTRITSIAFPLLVLAETHSPAQAGLVGFAQSLPYMLFYLPAGALVDRWDRKRVMLVTDAGRAIALGSLAVALALGTFALAHVIVVAFVEGTLFVFFSLSESAALPQVVPKEQLSTAVAQNQARIQGADLAGQPLGGALFGISRLLPFAADAISYAISFISLLFVKSQFQEERVRSTTRLRAEIVEGVTWLWRQQFMRAAVLLIAVSNFAFAAVILSLIVREQNLGASPGAIGADARVLRRRRARRIGVRALRPTPRAPQGRDHRVLLDLGGLRASSAPSSRTRTRSAPSGRLGGSFGPIFNVTFAAYRYALVPDRLLARVGSAALVVAWGADPARRSSAAGFLLEQLGGRETIRLLAGVMAAVGHRGSALADDADGATRVASCSARRCDVARRSARHGRRVPSRTASGRKHPGHDVGRRRRGTPSRSTPPSRRRALRGSSTPAPARGSAADALMAADPGIEVLAVRTAPLDVLLDRDQRVARLERRPDGRDQLTAARRARRAAHLVQHARRSPCDCRSG